MNAALEAARAKFSMPHDNHWTVAQFVETVDKQRLRMILLYHDTIIRRGKICDAKTKHLGAGIYRLWYEERP